jgi:hypothetical protein
MPRYDDDDDDFNDRPASRRRRADDDDDRPRRRRRFEDEEDDYDFEKRDLPHSGLGIAACALAAVALFAGLLAFAIIFAADLEDDLEGAIEAGDPKAVFATLLFVGSGFLSLIGAVLAGTGLSQERNKLFAILGLCANALYFLCGLGLMVLGSLA